MGAMAGSWRPANGAFRAPSGAQHGGGHVSTPRAVCLAALTCRGTEW